MSSSSSEDDMRYPVGLHKQHTEGEFNPDLLKTSSHAKHASWADHKFTSDGDVLTLDSPRPTGDRGKAEEDGHVRSLSGQLFGMNLSGSFSPSNSITYSPDPEVIEPSDEFIHEGVSKHALKVPSDLDTSYPIQQSRESVGRKHRRGLSHGKSNPSVAHRRVDSGGNTAFVNRQGHLSDGSFDRRSQNKGYNQHPPSHRDQHYHPPVEHRGYQGHPPNWHHQRRPSPHYDRDPGYAPPHGPPPPQHFRTSPHPSPPPHYDHPREDGRHRAREDPYYHRGHRSAPPRYHDHRGGYPPNPPVGSVHNIHPHNIYRHQSPHPSSYSESIGSASSRSGSRTHTPDSYQQRYQREEPAPYYSGQIADGHHPQNAPPPQHAYPIQHNDRNVRRSPPSHGPPLHPLADHSSSTLPPAPVPDSYQRQMSQCSLGTGSEGRIETEENLFATGSQVIPSQGNPRISPQLFDAVLSACPPPDRLPYDNRFAQGNNGDVQLPPPGIRARTASNDSFIRAIETSQVHTRGASIDSLVLDEALFGENILRERERSDSLAPISVIIAESQDSLHNPSTFMDPMSHNGYTVYPDQTQSQSIASPYEVGSYAAPSNESLITATSGPDIVSMNASSSSTEGPTDYESIGRHIQGKVSKRARRKCSVPACDNRVVQGGLCISHGAKRKTCGHLGCTKNVKKAGMCSAHGPPRKLCEYQHCSKVAVQGGKCIAHGAKKKLCLFDPCNKQAILNGMCKKHHDIQVEQETEYCQPVHQKGRNDSTVDGEQGGKPAHSRGLSIFTDNDIQEKIIAKEINLSGN